MNDWYIDRSKNILNDSLDKMLSFFDKHCFSPIESSKLVVLLKQEGIMGGAEGNINAALTRFRDHGLLRKDNTIGDAARDYLTGIIDAKELILDLICKRPAKKTNSPNVKPFLILCIVFDNMLQSIADVDDIFITYEECKEYLFSIDSYADVTFDLVDQIVSNRVYEYKSKMPKPRIELNENEDTNLSIWFNALRNTPIFMPVDDSKNILRPNIKQKEFFRFFAVNAEEISETPTSNNETLYNYYCSNNTGISEIIPTVIRTSATIDDVKDEQILFEYLFGYKKVANFNYNKYLRYECFGLFFPFITVPKLVLRSILHTNEQIGKALYHFVSLGHGYLEAFNEGNFEYKSELHLKLGNKLKFKAILHNDYNHNRIIFGAPGTGKSFLLEKERKVLLEDLSEDNFERVTFHPDYSYANFVGTYKPVMVTEHSISPVDNDTMYVLSVLTDKSKSAQEKYDELFDKFKDNGLTRLPLLLGLYTDESFKTRRANGSPAANDNDVERNHGRAIRKYINLIDGNEKPKGISYEYVPGPFMRLYVKALKNAQTSNPKPYLLIIEEINRANVAAVFGDIFQLLDRNDDGVSEYSIQASEDIKNYLAKEMGGKPDDYSKIRIPNNMFIWATMNSADQGVFPMDTAFKRRWDFTYIGIDDNEDGIADIEVSLKLNTDGHTEIQKFKWNDLRKAINEYLAKEKINEDKQLGPYFISGDVFSDISLELDKESNFSRVFKSKVIMYLFEDAARQKRLSLFAGCNDNCRNRYSKICTEFNKIGIRIFNSEIINATPYEEIKDSING